MGNKHPRKKIPEKEIPQRKIPKETTTTTRPPKPNCDCNNDEEITNQSAVIYTASGLTSLGRNWRNTSIKITIKSVVKCDPDRRQCLYEYTATAVVQKLNRGRWSDFRNLRAFINSFTVHDGVNETITSDRIDRPSINVTHWNPKAPLKESTEISLVVAPSIRGGNKITISKRAVVICVPKGDPAECPKE